MDQQLQPTSIIAPISAKRCFNPYSNGLVAATIIARLFPKNPCSFNPYSNGLVAATGNIKDKIEIEVICFNPYSNGLVAATADKIPSKPSETAVSILILMDQQLQLYTFLGMQKEIFSFNPYSNGLVAATYPFIH